MTPDDSASMLAWYIATELERLRLERGLTMSAVAQRLRCSTSHINHMEKGRDLPKAAELEVLLDFFEKGERIPSFLELLDAARNGGDWYEPFKGATPAWFDLFLGLENAAAQIESYDAQVVPGLFQLPEYAETVIRVHRPDLPEAEVARRVELRQARQQILTRTKPEAPSVWTVLDESVLYRTARDPQLMIKQLWHLDKMAELPNVTILIRPMAPGPGPELHGSFVILSLPHLAGLPAVAYTDGVIKGSYYKDPAEVLQYRNILTRVHNTALHPEESRTRIRQRAEELS